MAKQIINNNAMFIIYTDKERQEIEDNFKREYNKVKDKISEIVEVKIIKKDYRYIGIDKHNTIYPLKQYQNIVKARQKYKLYLNEYQKIIKLEKLA